MYTTLTYTYLLLPLAFLVNWKKWKFPDVYLIGLYGVIAFLLLLFDVDSVPRIYQKYYVYGYTLIEYTFFTLLISLSIRSRKAKLIMLVLSIGFFIFQCVYFFVAKVGRLDSIPVGVETILLFLYIFFFFYENFKTPKATFIYTHHCFWIAVGILLYLGGAFFFYILANHLDQTEIDKYWDLTYIAEILKNVFFVIAVFTFTPRQSGNSLKQNSSIPFLDMS